eukprot:scaffold74272_cov57-Phaeocystis_antarctica.AAC.1
MPVDFSATPRGNTALKRESKSATELVGSMLNVFKSKVRSHAPTAPPPASPLHPSRHRNAHHLGLERCPAQSRVPCALDDPRPPRPVRPRRALSHPTYWPAPAPQPSRRSMVDDGSGKVEVWRIEDFAEVVIPLDMHGQFFAGDSYIVQYTYLEGDKQAYILYFWLGSKSSQDEKGAAALLTKTKDDALGGTATHVRVVQGQEPSHFVRLFKGHMVVHEGGKASGFAGSEGDYYDPDGVSLFH